MLALSLLVLAGSGTLTFWLACAGVVRAAARTTSLPAETSAHALVLGLRLGQGGAVTPRYRQRLDRARSLLARQPDLRILILGGHTDRDAPSEAEAGRRYLLAAGVPPERILLEDRSRHTLENLRLCRERFPEIAAQRPLLITCRFHLRRSALLAHGLGIAHTLCAAEPSWRPGLAELPLLVKEALLIHWYVTGRLFARLTRNRRMLARIS